MVEEAYGVRLAALPELRVVAQLAAAVGALVVRAAVGRAEAVAAVAAADAAVGAIVIEEREHGAARGFINLVDYLGELLQVDHLQQWSPLRSLRL